MIKNICKILFFTVVFTLSSGCLKKGDDDPFISLKTRKARISGEWKLESGEISFKYSDTVETYTYAGTKIKYKFNGVFMWDYTFYETLVIDKKGTFGRTLQNRNLYTYEGYWYFGNENKKLDVKNKETIIFAEEEYTSPSQTYTWYGLNSVRTYYIERLTDKELVIKMDFSYYNTENEKEEVSEYWKYLKKTSEKDK